ncbi:hypothetical protein ACE939_05255 [Aquimarina sp. W85]|uniref:hypothetical protein n=1 Tax=Aquimarina rhodophyticola TaxID=3342246 RepID=UPI00366F5FED
MKSNFKKPVSIVVYSVAFLLITYFLIGVFIEYKIENTLNGMRSEGIQINYKALHIEPLFGNISFNNLEFVDQKQLKCTIEHLYIKDVSFWKLIKNKEVFIKEVTIENSKLHIEATKKQKNTAKKDKKESFTLNINKLDIVNSYIVLEQDSLQKESNTSIDISKMSIFRFATNASLLSQSIPFTYNSYKGEIRNFKTTIDPYHQLIMHSFDFNEKNWLVQELRIIPLFSKEVFINTIKYERDYMRLNKCSITIHAPKIEEIRNKIIFSSALIALDKIDFDIYRDKKLPDDMSVKPMYSELLRKLNILIAVDSISIKADQISYAELLENTTQPGKISFNDLRIGVSEINTLKTAVQNTVEIHIESKFMNQAPVTIDWAFDINSLSDSFNIRGAVKNVEASSMNAFIKPTLNIEANGRLDALYFDFSGNKDAALGSTAMSYNTFDVNILKEDGQHKKSVLTLLSNLIIDRKEDKGIVNQKDINVVRDKTKSFWNYFWICIKNGLIQTVL